jgi:hypothetical protein
MNNRTESNHESWNIMVWSTNIMRSIGFLKARIQDLIDWWLVDGEMMGSTRWLDMED